ncbi:ATP-binding protein [Blastococcus brunescens]|uniref:ATP-binding protein n=1 Tax=Blastococcus brunescens TaxID=1564165 RepID=A0ABZ1AY35_9ACTN|nr:ATP-binding protein [Blastococcus sp. BMG 8361]WRL62333.1 ATP-binding protein [Blastococcus sp. BMG 8361]
MAVALWQSAPSPFGFRELWCQELHSLAELAKLRARLRSTLTGSPTVVHPEREHWSERLVLIADELTSNALRHGGAPVATALSRTGNQWLLAVSDSSTEVPPTPAQGRDPSLGGFGLYLVADLSARHGWFGNRSTKTVWAVIDAD